MARERRQLITKTVKVLCQLDAKNRLLVEAIQKIAEVIAQIPGNKKPRNSLSYGVFKSGGRGRNRTGVGGFAIHK